MRSPFAIVVLFAIALLAACSPSTLMDSPLRLPLTPEPTLDPSDPLVQDARAYAEDMGVSLAEAVRRLELQDQIGTLGAALEQNESETFGGLWIQHEPEYRIVVAFTESGEEILRPYVEGDPYADQIEVRTVEYTLAELRAMQKEVHAILDDLGVDASSGIDVQNNRVELTIGNAEALEADLAAANVDLPPAVVVTEVGGPDAANRPVVETFETPAGKTIYFPKQAAGGAYMEALTEGVLVEENGCLRIESVHGGEATLVIWRNDQTLRIDDEGITVINGEGEVSGRVGEPIAMGGGEVRTVAEELQIEGCPGPYWIAGEEAPAPEVKTAEWLEVETLDSSLLLIWQGLAARTWDLEPSTVTGTVVRDGQCLRLASENGEDYLLIFPPGAAVSFEEDPFSVAIPAETETGWQSLARPGDQVTLAGSAVTQEKASDVYAQLSEALPAACPGPYWLLWLE